MADDRQWRDEAFPSELRELRENLAALIVLAGNDTTKQGALLEVLTNASAECIAAWAKDRTGGERMIELLCDGVAGAGMRKLIRLGKGEKKGAR